MRDIIVIVAMLIGALCSTGQQLKSAYENLCEDVEDCQEHVDEMWAHYGTACENVATAAYFVSHHMGFHGCDDPDECTQLKGLVEILDEKEEMADCSYEAWRESNIEYHRVMGERDQAQEDYTVHVYECQSCQQ